MAKKKFVIIDGNAILHRAYHALPPFTTKDGTLVNAVYGFATTMLKIFREIDPAYIAVAFDTAAPTFRHKEYKEYKATREKKPEELYRQIDYIKELLSVLNIPYYTADGFEADDIIATLIAKAEGKGTENIIVTGDMDTLQLVGKNTVVQTFKKGISDTVTFGEEEVKKKFGFAPEQLIDYKALRGDPSDNIPGVRGIGEKGAVMLIKNFGSIETLYKELERDTLKAKKISPRTRELLLKYKNDAFLWKKLVALVKAPLQFSLKSAERKFFNREELLALLRKFEFHSLIKRFGEGEKETKEKAVTRPSRFFLTLEEALDSIKKKPREAVLHGEILNKTLHLALSTPKGTIITADKKIIEGLKETFANPAAQIAGHDLKSLMHQLALSESNAVLHDVMIAAYLLDPGSRAHDLRSLVFTYLGRELPAEAKQQTLLGGEEDEKERLARIVEAIVELKDKLEAELKEKNLFKLYTEIESPLISVLYAMERHGVLLDTEFLGEMSKRSAKRIHELEKKIFKLAGEEFNINSPAQLAHILFEVLKISAKSIKKTATGAALSTAAGELEKLRGLHPMIDLIFEYRELSKLKSTYIDALPALTGVDGRIHTTFNQAITATGRLSSKDPNLQNIPIKTELGREIRKAFIADKGSTLIAADYSQFELRIAAHLSNDKAMIEDFKSGEDIHTRTSEIIWGVDHTQVTKEMRRIAKAINFGIIYGMGPRKLAAEAGVSLEEARNFIDRFFAGRARLQEYLEELKALAAAQGYVETMFGRRRYLPEITSGVPGLRAEAERQAVNTPIQGTQADVIKIAMINLAKILPQKFGNDLIMILQVHDELVFEVKDNRVHEAAPIIQEIMENAVKLSVPIVVEIDIGKNWGEMRKWG